MGHLSNKAKNVVPDFRTFEKGSEAAEDEPDSIHEQSLDKAMELFFNTTTNFEVKSRMWDCRRKLQEEKPQSNPEQSLKGARECFFITMKHFGQINKNMIEEVKREKKNPI